MATRCALLRCLTVAVAALHLRYQCVRPRRRTLKYLMGVLGGKWMVGASWPAACLEAGVPVPEEPHEITGDASGGQSGAILGRLAHASGAPPLLQGHEVNVAPSKLALGILDNGMELIK